MESRLLPATFLNPLPVLAEPMRQAEALGESVGASIDASIEGTIAALGRGTKNLATGAANTAAKAAATATQPVGSGLEAVGKGMSDTAGFLSHAADAADDIAKKVFWGELVFAALALVGLGVAAYVAHARSKSSVTQILFGRARSQEEE